MKSIKSIIYILSLIIIFTLPYGNSIDPTSKTYTLLNVDEPPEFPGGDAALLEWISDNIQSPKLSKTDIHKTYISIRTIITKDGTLILADSAEKYLESYPKYGAEIRRLLSIMPKWVPATVDGKPVDVIYFITFKFEKVY